MSCVAESEDIKESQRIAKLGGEGKARVDARDAMKQQAMSYAMKLDLKEDIGEYFEGRNSNMKQGSSLGDGGDSDAKFASLKAEGEARIDKRMKAKAEYEQAKKVQDLKAEGEARVVAKAEMKDKYENAAEFGIPAGGSAIASAFGYSADGTFGNDKADQKVPKLVQEAGEKMKIQGLKAEGEARIAEREAMVEAQKIYELTQVLSVKLSAKHSAKQCKS